MGKIARKYRTVTTCPPASPKRPRATTVMSSPGLSEAATKRDRPRCARNVIGPMSKVAIISGHTPPAPAFIGRNRMPAPTAVPNRERAQLFSKRRRLWMVRLLLCEVGSLKFDLDSGSAGSCDIHAVYFLKVVEHDVSLLKLSVAFNNAR